MPGDVTLRMKEFFLDRQRVIEALKRAKAKALSRVGAFIRRRARSSLRRRKRISPAGSPPSVHSDDSVATLKNILFAYEPQSQTLVVGPLKLNQQLGGVTVPQLHEFGASVQVREVRVGQYWRTGVRRPRPGQPVRTRRATYPSRPFMGPALEAERANIPDAWRGTIGD